MVVTHFFIFGVIWLKSPEFEVIIQERFNQVHNQHHLWDCNLVLDISSRFNVFNTPISTAAPIDVKTAVKSQGKTITSSAVCHDSKTKKSIRQSFFNFQENLNEGK
jgi:hypothetical protein